MKLFVELIYEPWLFGPHKSPRLKPQEDFFLDDYHVSQEDGLDPKILYYIEKKSI